MDSRAKKRVYNHLEIKGFVLLDLIKEKFDKKFGEKSTGQLEWVNSMLKLHLRAKIDTEVNRMSPELTRQAIELRENNWERIVDYLKENFNEADAKYLKDKYKAYTENQVKLYTLEHSKNPFKKAKIVKEELKNMEKERENETEETL